MYTPKPSPCCNHASQSLSFLRDGSVVDRMIESPKIRPNLQEPVMWFEKGLLQGQWYTLAHPALKMQRQEDHSKFQLSLVYITNPRPWRATL